MIFFFYMNMMVKPLVWDLQAKESSEVDPFSEGDIDSWLMTFSFHNTLSISTITWDS